jgi:hypothetical protein
MNAQMAQGIVGGQGGWPDSSDDDPQCMGSDQASVQGTCTEYMAVR